jgi:hypothetical protein
MAGPLNQAPGPGGESGAPIYTQKELNEKLDMLLDKMKRVMEPYNVAYRRLLDMLVAMDAMSSIRRDFLYMVGYAIVDLEHAVKDVIDEMIVNELGVDTDIEKYEKEYGVRFDYDEDSLLGVVMLKKGETVMPVAIWTDYKSIGFCTGEKNE